ncbi:integrase core domain-containing protein [Microbacterium lacticum]
MRAASTRRSRSPTGSSTKASTRPSGPSATRTTTPRGVADRPVQVRADPPRRPWRDVDQVEAATASWVLWFNTERTHGSIDDLTPLEVEQLDYARNEPVEQAG